MSSKTQDIKYNLPGECHLKRNPQSSKMNKLKVSALEVILQNLNTNVARLEANTELANKIADRAKKNIDDLNVLYKKNSDSNCPQRVVRFDYIFEASLFLSLKDLGNLLTVSKELQKTISISQQIVALSYFKKINHSECLYKINSVTWTSTNWVNEVKMHLIRRNLTIL